MKQIIRSTWLVALLAFAFGCGSSKGGEGGNGGGNGGSGPTCEATCSSGDDCESVACECKDGSVVNSSSCNNGCCETEAGACPSACSDHGGWGSSGGGGEGGGSSGGAGFDEECSSNSDCDSGVCFYVDPDDESTQKCTIECSFGGGECPSGWDCAEVQGGAQTLCILQ
ncbi:Hypothetical protein A7982_09203 [Minicystis rosea]|nr:Hypothetical protein A7982_09203 [Minicystis rosea]